MAPLGKLVLTIPVIGSCVSIVPVIAVPVGDQLASVDQLSGAGT
jgi:hypothetical protein